MNIYVLLAGIFCSLTTLGHFIMGYKLYVKPMLAATMDEIPKKVMLSVFHYMSVFLVLSTVSLLLIAFKALPGDSNHTLILIFIAINFALMSLAQFLIALMSKIPSGIIKMFQWIFFAMVAIFTWLGVISIDRFC